MRGGLRRLGRGWRGLVRRWRKPAWPWPRRIAPMPESSPPAAASTEAAPAQRNPDPAESPAEQAQSSPEPARSPSDPAESPSKQAPLPSDPAESPAEQAQSPSNPAESPAEQDPSSSDRALSPAEAALPSETGSTPVKPTRPAFRWRTWRLPGGLRPWITCLSLGFLMAALLSHGRQMRQYTLDAQGWLWLVLGVGCCLLSLVVSGLAWVVILRWLGLRPRSTPVVSLYILSNLRKFLPGGIWHLASRVQALRQPNAALGAPASTGTALLAVLIEPVLAATAALALVSLGGWQNGLGLLTLLPLALLAPRWLNPLLPRLERGKASRLGLSAPDSLAESTEPSGTTPTEAHPPPASDAETTLRTIPVKDYPWLPLLAQVAFVLLRFAGLACCVWAFDLQQTLPWPSWLSAFALAWTVGLVVPGAPGGLGVFEAALLLRLSGALPEPAVLAVALSYRLVVTVADLLAAALVGLDEKMSTLDGPSA